MRCSVSNSIMNSLPGSRLSYFKPLQAGSGDLLLPLSHQISCLLLFLTMTLWSKIYFLISKYYQNGCDYNNLVKRAGIVASFKIGIKFLNTYQIKIANEI